MASMLAQLTSFATVGITALPVTVEVAAPRGEGKMMIVGLGDTAVKESQQRVWMALKSGGFRFPTGRTITVNLAPASLRKAGPRYDLPIALGLLAVSGVLDVPPEELRKTAFLGELALDGSVRHVTGVLPASIACRDLGIKRLVVPAVNATEAAVIEGVEVIPAMHLTDILGILMGDHAAPAIESIKNVVRNPTYDAIDFADVRGQHGAKRALEIAAAGGHNVLLSGAPGAGKTLLARALPAILPPMSTEESIEVTQIYSIANLLPADMPLIIERPFRAVHHTASAVSIVGGGQTPGPGEISLAHRGVLFLDELAEFPPQVLEVLRQPLEDRRITITRAQGSVTFPADFTLVAAMNPPQYGGDARRMKTRISAPLLDRIDLTISVDPVDIDDLQKRPSPDTERSLSIAKRVIGARQRQAERFKDLPLSTNKEMNVRHLDELCSLTIEGMSLLKQATQKLGLSARAYHRTIKVARTIADLEGAKEITIPHLAEALQYRQSLYEES